MFCAIGQNTTYCKYDCCGDECCSSRIKNIEKSTVVCLIGLVLVVLAIIAICCFKRHRRKAITNLSTDGCQARITYPVRTTVGSGTYPGNGTNYWQQEPIAFNNNAFQFTTAQILQDPPPYSSVPAPESEVLTNLNGKDKPPSYVQYDPTTCTMFSHPSQDDPPQYSAAGSTTGAQYHILPRLNNSDEPPAYAE